MPYNKTLWKDRVVEKPMTYTMRTNADGTITLVPAEGQILEVGTPLTAVNLNNLEKQYEEVLAWVRENAQMVKLSADTGLRTKLAAGFDILTLGVGFYYGASLNIPSHPIPGSTAWYNIDVTQSEQGMKQFRLQRNADGRTWIGTVHSDNVFRGWYEVVTDSPLIWTNLSLQNGWVAGLTTPQYSIIGNEVVFRGRIKNGQFGGASYLPAFTMPSIVKPTTSHALLIAGYINNHWARVYLFDDGKISVITTATGATDNELDLAGLRYCYK
ncbi:hypothetical protein AM500_21350 [Bacillus sp. FJAT-18017]|uniref:hypothetical protein n=1 Tax=Bacillus sp. FJAT-18017 TaxID=1705566 RepID=UPI0006AFBF0A|nr:hypothetical protein [Bacillus sp. FJAT-18017]ALC92056.1 hypothetical protein AM500_21350 [Bacillus sp. FJAT-18017]